MLGKNHVVVSVNEDFETGDYRMMVKVDRPMMQELGEPGLRERYVKIVAEEMAHKLDLAIMEALGVRRR